MGSAPHLHACRSLLGAAAGARTSRRVFNGPVICTRVSHSTPSSLSSAEHRSGQDRPSRTRCDRRGRRCVLTPHGRAGSSVPSGTQADGVATTWCVATHRERQRARGHESLRLPQEVTNATPSHASLVGASHVVTLNLKGGRDSDQPGPGAEGSGPHGPRQDGVTPT